ncbi:MAG: hypothetical protein JSV62_09625 [Promethearchaeota archaeon]|nr:MAG: hypothetical protein JSV62_09625 [Candidatus Lokiarchaeota archaeon]
MSNVVETESIEFHEKIAKSTFNKTWDYLDKKDRTVEDELNMIHTVHASRYHWGILVSEGKGGPINLQRGEWIISRVYSVIGRGEPAIYHAKKCLELTEENDIGDFDLAFAYEAMARAFALLKNKKEFEKYLKLANEAGEEIKNKGDKEYFFEELNSGPWNGMK